MNTFCEAMQWSFTIHRLVLSFLELRCISFSFSEQNNFFPPFHCSGGTLTVQDLASYKVAVTDAWAVPLGEYQMYIPPPPAGGTILSLILNILKGSCSTQSYCSSTRSNHMMQCGSFVHVLNRSSQIIAVVDGCIYKLLSLLLWNKETEEFLHARQSSRATIGSGIKSSETRNTNSLFFIHRIWPEFSITDRWTKDSSVSPLCWSFQVCQWTKETHPSTVHLGRSESNKMLLLTFALIFTHAIAVHITSTLT